MGRGVILVRHALPEVTRGLASALWPLSEAAKEDCVLLAHALPARLAPTVYTSAERKAEETAVVLGLRRGLEVSVDDRLREVDRPDEWVEDYRDAVRDYLARGGRPGWEPPDRAAGRFAAAVDEALAAHREGDLMVVNHGIALTLFLATRTPLDPLTFWPALAFPDAWRLDTATGELGHIYRAGLPPE